MRWTSFIFNQLILPIRRLWVGKINLNTKVTPQTQPISEKASVAIRPHFIVGQYGRKTTIDACRKIKIYVPISPTVTSSIYFRLIHKPTK